MIQKNYIGRAEQRWEEKITLIKVMNLLNTDDKPVIHSSHGICYGIIIFGSLSVRIMTSNHIKNLQNIINPPNLSTILYEDHILHKK